jgi:hypothetical protein
MPGSSAAAGRDGQLAAALGTKWAHAVNVRLILERIVEGGEERRFIKVTERFCLVQNILTIWY